MSIYENLNFWGQSRNSPMEDGDRYSGGINIVLFSHVGVAVVIL